MDAPPPPEPRQEKDVESVSNITKEDIGHALRIKEENLQEFIKISNAVNDRPDPLPELERFMYRGEQFRTLGITQLNAHQKLRTIQGKLERKIFITQSDIEITLKALIDFMEAWNAYHDYSAETRLRRIEGLAELKALHSSNVEIVVMRELAVRQHKANFNITEEQEITYRHDYLSNEYGEIIDTLVMKNVLYKDLLSSCSVQNKVVTEDVLFTYLQSIGVELKSSPNSISEDDQEHVLALKMLVAYLAQERDNVTEYCETKGLIKDSVTIREILPVIAGGGLLSSALSSFAPTLDQMRLQDITQIDSMLKAMNELSDDNAELISVYQEKLFVLCKKEGVLSKYSDAEIELFIRNSFIPKVIQTKTSLPVQNELAAMNLNAASKELTTAIRNTVTSDSAIDMMISSLWIQNDKDRQTQVRDELKSILQQNSSTLSNKDFAITYMFLVDENGATQPSFSLGLQVMHLLGKEQKNTDMVLDLKADVANFTYSVFKKYIFSYLMFWQGDPIQSIEEMIDNMEHLNEEQKRDLKNSYKLFNQKVKDALHVQYKNFGNAPIEIKLFILMSVMQSLLWILGPYVGARFAYRLGVSGPAISKIKKFQENLRKLSNSQIRTKYRLEGITDDQIQKLIKDKIDDLIVDHNHHNTMSKWFRTGKRSGIRTEGLRLMDNVQNGNVHSLGQQSDNLGYNPVRREHLRKVEMPLATRVKLAKELLGGVPKGVNLSSVIETAHAFKNEELLAIYAKIDDATALSDGAKIRSAKKELYALLREKIEKVVELSGGKIKPKQASLLVRKGVCGLGPNGMVSQMPALKQKFELLDRFERSKTLNQAQRVKEWESIASDPNAQAAARLNDDLADAVRALEKAPQSSLMKGGKYALPLVIDAIFIALNEQRIAEAVEAGDLDTARVLKANRVSLGLAGTAGLGITAGPAAAALPLTGVLVAGSMYSDYLIEHAIKLNKTGTSDYLKQSPSKILSEVLNAQASWGLADPATWFDNRVSGQDTREARHKQALYAYVLKGMPIATTQEESDNNVRQAVANMSYLQYQLQQSGNMLSSQHLQNMDALQRLQQLKAAGYTALQINNNQPAIDVSKLPDYEPTAAYYQKIQPLINTYQAYKLEKARLHMQAANTIEDSLQTDRLAEACLKQRVQHTMLMADAVLQSWSNQNKAQVVRIELYKKYLGLQKYVKSTIQNKKTTDETIQQIFRKFDDTCAAISHDWYVQADNPLKDALEYVPAVTSLDASNNAKTRTARFKGVNSMLVEQYNVASLDELVVSLFE